MSDLLEAVETPVVETPAVEVETKPCCAETQIAPVNLYDELDKQSFSFLLAIRDYLGELLSKKAAEEKTALLEKSLELSSYLGVDVNALLTPPKSKKVKADTEPKIKYKDDNGNTWTGKGPKPAWFKAAVESGVDPESFRVV